MGCPTHALHGVHNTPGSSQAHSILYAIKKKTCLYAEGFLAVELNHKKINLTIPMPENPIDKFRNWGNRTPLSKTPTKMNKNETGGKRKKKKKV